MAGSRTPTNKYRQAAITYLAYGLVYLIGAVYTAHTGISDRGFEEGYAWVYLVLGGALILIIPLLIWNEYTWLTRLIAVLLLIRAGGLARVILQDGGRAVPMPWNGHAPMGWGAGAFMLVALGTCAMCVRAGWDLPP
jgi:hypothetical protein